MVNATRIPDSVAQPRIGLPLLGLLGLLVCTIAVPLPANAAFNTTYILYEVTSTVDTLEGADATTLAALAAENITVGAALTLTTMIPEDQVGVEVECAPASGENLVYAADDPSRGTEITVGNLVLSNMQDANALGVADDIPVEVGPLGPQPTDVFGIAGDTSDTNITRFPLDSTPESAPCAGDSKGSAMLAVRSISSEKAPSTIRPFRRPRPCGYPASSTRPSSKVTRLPAPG
jgi:hypothetical protein